MQPHPIRAVMEKRGVSQAVLAKESGYARQYLNRVFLGRDPGSRRLYRVLAHVLGVDVQDITPRYEAAA